MSDAVLTLGKFRWLVALFAVSTLALWTLPFFAIAPSEEALAALRTYDGFDAVIPHDGALYWGLLSLWLMATIALGLCWRNSREMFLGLTVISVAMSCLTGTRVSFALDGVVAYVSVLLNGAILAMAYGSELSAYFVAGPGRLRASA
jgi:hypothetical protein